MKRVDRKDQDQKREKKEQWQPILERHAEEKAGRGESRSGEGTNECGSTNSANEGKKKDGSGKRRNARETRRPSCTRQQPPAAPRTIFPSIQLSLLFFFSVTGKRDHSIMSIAFPVQHIRPYTTR